MPVREVLADHRETVATLPIYELLTWQHRWQADRAGAALLRLGINPLRRVELLTDRQVGVIADYVETGQREEREPGPVEDVAWINDGGRASMRHMRTAGLLYTLCGVPVGDRTTSADRGRGPCKGCARVARSRGLQPDRPDW